MSTSYAISAAAIADAFCASLTNSQSSLEPYKHYILSDALPKNVIHDLATLPFKAPSLEGVSGKRELHNDTRSYFDKDAMARYPVMDAVAEALQSHKVTSTIASFCKAEIDDTFLRLEYAQDIDGFWLEPHTDLGVKKFTCLIYLSDDHADLGTDIYAAPDQHFGRSPFAPGMAMIFVPGTNTWHGFEKRPIHGVRKSVILNYVTHEWRAREQLSYPDTPVRL
jgi:hypothetical protein